MEFGNRFLKIMLEELESDAFAMSKKVSEKAKRRRCDEEEDIEKNRGRFYKLGGLFWPRRAPKPTLSGTVMSERSRRLWG